MRGYNPKERFALSSIRDYVRLLVASIVILALSLIGYIFWHDNQHRKLAEVADLYHLETILYCTRIKEQVMHILPPVADGQPYKLHSHEQNRFESNHSGFVYSLEIHTREISQLQETYTAASRQAARFEPIVHKANRQLAGIKAMLQEPDATGMTTTDTSVNSLLVSFTHTIEQLNRLHTIARDEIHNELQTLKANSSARLLTALFLALLLGSMVVWRILKEIQHLVETHRHTETILRQSATLFESASEGVLITDTDVKIIAVNKAFTTITGYSEKEVLGKNPSILKSGRHDREFYKTMWSSLLQHDKWRGEISGRRKNGEVFTKWQTISAVRIDGEGLTNYVSMFSDISHIKKSEEQLYQLAHHDTLTGLPNRLLLTARLEHSLQHAQREGTHVAVLFLDLDHFKKVNDSLGHPVGDQLLQLVAKRLLLTVRDEDTVARLGGDELTIVLGSLDDTSHAGTIAQEILDSLSKPFELEGQEVFMSASIGISVCPGDGRDATALLKNADAAMYTAKSAGRNAYHFYSKELTENASETLALETDLRRALENEELFLHFQPQVSLQSGNIVGVEALVRWQHPEIGPVSPNRFIPLAEESGLIGAIGIWVLRTACAQARAWQKDGYNPFRIAVNISERQLRQPDFVREIRDILEETGLDPCYLELELTENSVMQHAEQALMTLNALRELGITIAIDDFGTGYSSLSYLKLFPVDRLKIDRSFVHDIPRDENDVAIVRAIVTLGHSLNLSVVAEGVETQAQIELLTSIGCDEMQGFLYSAPKAASELQTILDPTIRSACIND